MRRTAALAATLALLATPGAAEASKAPTKTQRASIAKKFGAPASCLKIRVSTAQRGWAVAMFDGKKYDTADCADHASNGIMVMRAIEGGRWAKRYAGSDCMRLSAKRVPLRVWRDLSPVGGCS